ncbi:MAG: BadM/Rrf2 family transcriptional regulator [Proteobacteria bacterium]|nr:MAG: BadM/Rrf2 family transcriptional regulator [Pseudomonadota bacterium]
MRLTTFTDYSLRILMYLAARPERRATIADIAKAFDISENHLVKCAHFLGKTGWLSNSRGRGGGLTLAVAPSAINLAEVIRITEDGDVPAECFQSDTNTCPITASCRLRGIFSEAVLAFYGVIAQYTLEDVVRNRVVLKKMLFHSHPPAA